MDFLLLIWWFFTFWIFKIMFLFLLYAIMINTLCTDLGMRFCFQNMERQKEDCWGREAFLMQGLCERLYYLMELLTLLLTVTMWTSAHLAALRLFLKWIMHVSAGKSVLTILLMFSCWLLDSYMSISFSFFKNVFLGCSFWRHHISQCVYDFCFCLMVDYFTVFWTLLTLPWTVAGSLTSLSFRFLSSASHSAHQCPKVPLKIMLSQ